MVPTMSKSVKIWMEQLASVALTVGHLKCLQLNPRSEWPITMIGYYAA